MSLLPQEILLALQLLQKICNTQKNSSQTRKIKRAKHLFKTSRQLETSTLKIFY